MYNGAPPFRPPTLPPFAPTLPPGSAPPSAFPPFPPGGPGGPGAPGGYGGPPGVPGGPGFVRPPFAPPFSPNGQFPPGPGGPSPGHAGSPVHMHNGPPPRQFLNIRGGNNPQSSLPAAPPSLPTPPTRTASSGGDKAVKTTSVFLGGISPGITDNMLKDLLNTCGPLHELKRVSGANGKPQAFGFALFEDPNAVMRCIRCLNGVELPDLTPEGMAAKKPAKALVAKVDDKTKAFLDEFEQTLGRTDEDETADATARKSIAHIVALMTDPNAIAPEGVAPEITREPLQVIVPAHLQDLREGDLPEGQRVAVLDQISLFRETAARKEREKKARELEAERRGEQHRPLTTADYGYGTRPFGHHGTGPSPNANNTSQHGQYGNNRYQQGQAHGAQANGRKDPQGYSEPVAFVKAQAAESKLESNRTDEEEEELRLARRARERDQALRERERMVEQRERHRIEAYNREMAIRHQQEELISKNKVLQSEHLAMWDDDELLQRGRELFLVDRPRWRDQRHQMRTREYQEDVRDRQMEAEELRQIEKESEAFLAQQMAELEELDNKEKQQGLLTEDAAPIKVALAPVAIAAPAIATSSDKLKPDSATGTGIASAASGTRSTPEPTKVKPRAALDFGGDDDEEDGGARRKRQTFVKLEPDAGSSGAGMSAAEREALNRAKLLEIKAELPTGAAVLKTYVQWRSIEEATLQNKLRPVIDDQLQKLLGEIDEDVADVILEHMQAQKSAKDLVDDLEGPLGGDEATTLVTVLYRQLLFEGFAKGAGLDTGSMTV